MSLSTFFVTQVCNNLWFPLIFFHKLRRQAQRPAPVLGIVLDVAIGILGVLVFIYGLKGSVETLMKDFGCLGSKSKGSSFLWPKIELPAFHPQESFRKRKKHIMKKIFSAPFLSSLTRT